VDGSSLKGASFNIGSKEEVSIRELAEIALKVSGAESEITSVDGHPGDTVRRVPDTSAAETALGWYSTVSVEEGMHRCWEWMLPE
jgi:nucleoside-diphosphate-sugar epimerase